MRILHIAECCRWRRALSPDAPAKIREKGIKQYFICFLEKCQPSAYNKMVMRGRKWVYAIIFTFESDC